MSLRNIAILVSLLGMLVSGYAFYQHYAPKGESFCNISDTFSCDLVNKSPWSTIQKVPVAFVGLVGYAFLLSLLFFRPTAWQIWFFVFTLAGLIFSLYLTYLEAYILHAWCVLCLTSLACISVLTIFAALIMRSEKLQALDKPSSSR